MKTHQQLADIAQTVRKLTVAAIYNAESGHPGGALSCSDLLTYCFNNILDITPNNATELTRDRFVLSKGHAAPSLYAIAATQELMTPEEALSLRKLGSVAQGHPDKLSMNWLDASTGSLGQGFANALGMAMSYQYQSLGAKVVTLLGDGELQEGQVWETAMCAAHFKLGNLTAIIDYNKLQSDDLNKNIMGLEPLKQKFEAFGWHVMEIDGHSFLEIENAFNEAQNETSKPSVIIAHTIKGKGVSYMEEAPTWHGSVRMTRQDTISALTQLGMSETAAEAWLSESVQRVN